MLDCLERTDRLPEGVALLGVVDGSLRRLAGGSHHQRSREYCGQVHQLLRNPSAGLRRPYHIRHGYAHAFEANHCLGIRGGRD